MKIRTRLIIGPAGDAALSLLWVPFALAAFAVQNSIGATQALMLLAIGMSTAHQPLTLPLVYADSEKFSQRPKLFTWTPFVALAAVVIGLQVSLLAVAVAAGVWNAVHTLQQRYGIARIYGRKSGRSDGRLDRALLWGWLIAVATWSAAAPSTQEAVSRVAIGDRNRAGVEFLTGLRGPAAVIFPFIAVIVAAITVWWVVSERRSGEQNPARWAYVASTGLLFALIVINPIAGFIAYVGSHAVEYIIVVWHHLQRLEPDRRPSPTALAAAVGSRLGRLGFVTLFVACSFAILLMIHRLDANLYTVAFLTVGTLHVFYDGVIWKLRTPDVADGFDLEPGESVAAHSQAPIGV